MTEVIAGPVCLFSVHKISVNKIFLKITFENDTVFELVSRDKFSKVKTKKITFFLPNIYIIYDVQTNSINCISSKILEFVS